MEKLKRLFPIAKKIVLQYKTSSMPMTRKHASLPSSYRCDAHMNELPVPCGPWHIYYNDKQAFYNKVLVGGAIWFVLSVALMLWTESIFLNWRPPAQPSIPTEAILRCDGDL